MTRFRAFPGAHKGRPENIVEVVCDMSPAFLSAVEQKFRSASVTADWFHVVQLFTRAVDDVRKLEARQSGLPDHTRWAVLKSAETTRTQNRENALLELVEQGFAATRACRVKELPRRVRRAESQHAAKWRITRFLRHAPSTRLTARCWSPCAEHWSALKGSCREFLIVGIPCTPMRGSKASMACSGRQGPEPEDTGTWGISSSWST